MSHNRGQGWAQEALEGVTQNRSQGWAQEALEGVSHNRRQGWAQEALEDVSQKEAGVGTGGSGGRVHNIGAKGGHRRH